MEHRIFRTTVASVYPLYVAKLQRKWAQLVDELARGKAMDKVLRGGLPKPA